MATTFSSYAALPSIPISVIHSGEPKTLESSDAAINISTPSFANKLNNVDAQRIISVLSELQKKVAIIAELPEFDYQYSHTTNEESNGGTRSDKVVLLLGQEVGHLLKIHVSLEQQLHNLISIKQSGDPVAKADVFLQEYKSLTHQLRSSTRNIMRSYHQNPSLTGMLSYLKSSKHNSIISDTSKLNSTSNEVLAKIEQYVADINVFSYEKLRITVEEEKALEEELKVTTAKELKTNQDVAILREELEKAQKARTTEVNKRNDIIRKLKDELRQIKHLAEETTRRLEARSKQKEDAEMNSFKARESILQSEIAALQKQYSETLAKNREEEVILRKKKYKIESEVEAWIQKYDQELEEKQVELDDITVIYSEEKKQLDELLIRFDDLQKEYNLILEERKNTEEQKRKEEELKAKREKAAITIQRVWRGYKTRKDLKKKKSEKSASAKTKRKTGKKK